MIVLIIRHGESEADLLNVHEGRADFSLTTKGLKQVNAMCEYVKKNFHVNKIYSSTLMRARQTAEALGKAFALPIIFDEDLMEFNNGLIAGLTREEALRLYPEVLDLPIDKAVYGQESKVEFRNRANKVLAKITKENSEDDVIAVITHGGMINQLYYSLLGLPVKNDSFFGSSDTGIHVWRIGKDKTSIIKSNYSDHIIDVN